MADVCWMAARPLRAGRALAIKHTTRTARAIVGGIHHRIDVDTLIPDPSAQELALNDIGRS